VRLQRTDGAPALRKYTFSLITCETPGIFDGYVVVTAPLLPT
jgi:hypothetical protein